MFMMALRMVKNIFAGSGFVKKSARLSARYNGGEWCFEAGEWIGSDLEVAESVDLHAGLES